MQHRECYVRVYGVLAAMLAAGGRDRALAQEVVVSPPVFASPPGAGAHSFTNIAADPENAGHLIACGIRAVSRTSAWQGFVYRSTDGGAHWTPVLVDTSARLVSEEACAFGPNGHAYFIAEGWNERFERRRLGSGILRLYRSLDAGATWTPVIVDPTAGAWMDYARIAVDGTNGAHRGRVYIFSNDRPDELRPAVSPMRYSVDEGLHFSERVPLPLPVSPSGGFPHSVVVLPSGTVVAGYTNTYAPGGRGPSPTDPTAVIDRGKASPLLLMQAVRSTDGGRTLEPPITIGHGSDFVSLAVDTSSGPYHGRLYAVWSDTMTGQSRIFMAESADEGRTWTDRHMLGESSSRAAARTSDVMSRSGSRSPHIAVNRDGVVGMSWVEDGMCWFFAASRDGGHTFLPRVPLNVCPRDDLSAFRINEHLATLAGVVPLNGASIDPTRTGFTIAAGPGGGAAGIAAGADGAFHPIWSIEGTDSELWTTRVEVRPVNSPPVAPSNSSITSLTDVTQRVAVRVASEHYDPGTGELMVDIYVASNDSLAIRGPLKIQLKRLESALARSVQVVNADNSVPGVGAVWSVRTATADDALAAYARSALRRLVFRFPDGLMGGALKLDLKNPQSIVIVVELQIFAS